MNIDEIYEESKSILGMHKNILVSISGGADSDVVIDIMSKTCDDPSKLHYVFFDTGIEYDATKRHLDYLQEKYDIEIERLKPVHNVPYACMHDGLPFLNKYIATNIHRLQKYDFDWSDEPFEVLVEKYPNCVSALKWWCNANGETSRFNIKFKKYLKEFLMAHPPDFKISSKCCKYSKKDTSDSYARENNIDLIVTGLRKSEGGIRMVAYNGTYSDNENVHSYRPLWFMSNEEKDLYCSNNDIVHSDCYSKYKMTRTGCAGCPFDRYYLSSLANLKMHEPRLYATVKNLFGKSYKYTNDFLQFAYNMKKGKI